MSKPPNQYWRACAIQVFYAANWFHDKTFHLGFDEGFGNFQDVNFTQEGEAGDAIRIRLQPSADYDNAYFTPGVEDGSYASITMGIFTGGDPDRDSALDTQILLHELTHGLSIRIHGESLLSGHSRGLGEGWSDFISMSLLAKSTDDPHVVYPYGSYSSLGFRSPNSINNYYFGIRRYPYSTSKQINPVTFAYIDPAQCPFVTNWSVPINPVAIYCSSGSHAIGIVWASALWDLRAKLMDQYGFEGNAMLLQLVLDAMKLNPISPQLTEARDALLQADFVRYGGRHRCLIWKAFAGRGLGLEAIPPEPGTTSVVEDFQVPSFCYHYNWSTNVHVLQAIDAIMMDQFLR